MARITKAQINAELKASCKAELLKMLQPGSEIYTVLKHVSVSGMSREIQLLATENGHIRNISHLAAQVMGDKIGNHDGIKKSGCGMDMGFALVYNLGRCLFPDGFKIDGRGRNGDTSGHDNDGGYALKQRWL